MPRPPQPTRIRGQSLVEFALILPILLLLLAGAIDLGRAYFSAISLENAVKEGAFFGARDPECATDASTDCADPANVEARVEIEMDGLSLTFFEAKCFAPGTTDFSGAGKVLSDCDDGDLYFVRAELPFTLVTPIISFITGSPITLSSDATAVVITSFQALGGQVTFPSATPMPTPGPGMCTVPDFTLGPTKLNQAADVWANNAGFDRDKLDAVGPGGQDVSWQSLPHGTVAECDTQTIIVSNAVQATATPTPTPSPSPSPSPTPAGTPAGTPTPTPAATATPTPTPTPSGNCTVPALTNFVVTVGQARWVQAGFIAANFDVKRGPWDDYVIRRQSLAVGSVHPCLTTVVEVRN